MISNCAKQNVKEKKRQNGRENITEFLWINHPVQILYAGSASVDNPSNKSKKKIRRPGIRLS